MLIFPMLLLALVATILIEFVVLWLLGERNRLVLGSSVVINMLTNLGVERENILLDDFGG